VIDEEKAGRYLDEIRSLHADNDRLESELSAAKIRVARLEAELEHHVWCATCAQDGCSSCHECKAKELLSRE